MRQKLTIAVSEKNKTKIDDEFSRKDVFWIHSAELCIDLIFFHYFYQNNRDRVNFSGFSLLN